MKRPQVVDLFAGAGGLSLGFEQAGFDIAAAVEIDPIHALVHKFNFPSSTVVPHSVVGLTGNAIREFSQLGSRRVDVVVGGAPCQGFSLIGHRALDDPRNRLVAEFVRLVSELDAPYFVFENVKGLTVGKHRSFLDEIIGAFEEAGYAVRTPWQVLNARNHGVPQDRERLFLLGARRGMSLPDYPSIDPACPTCADALDDLPDIEEFPELCGSDSVSIGGGWGSLSKYARQLRCADNDAWHFGHPRNWQSSLLTSSARTFHTPISRRRFAATACGNVEPVSRFFKLSAAGVSNTLRAGTDGARGAFTSPRPIHYDKPRCVSVREMARLHGYPDWFRFHATKWHGARQIGNSVPPPLARAVASQVALAMGYWPVRQTKAIDLGDSSWLGNTLTEAAAYFGVASPSGRRDRKSGARKRKQSEIEDGMRDFEAAHG